MREISLTKGKVALVDEDDYVWLSKRKWFCDSNGYAARSTKYRKENGKLGNRTVLMHREIMQTPDGILLDHRDTNRLNNQRLNLRECTKQQNCMNRKVHVKNTSGFKGVSWSTAKSKWVAQIMIDGKVKYLGAHDEPIDGARAYNAAAREHFGEFAYLNEI